MDNANSLSDLITESSRLQDPRGLVWLGGERLEQSFKVEADVVVKSDCEGTQREYKL